MNKRKRKSYRNIGVWWTDRMTYSVQVASRTRAARVLMLEGRFYFKGAINCSHPRRICIDTYSPRRICTENENEYWSASSLMAWPYQYNPSDFTADLRHCVRYTRNSDGSRISWWGGWPSLLFSLPFPPSRLPSLPFSSPFPLPFPLLLIFTGPSFPFPYPPFPSALHPFLPFPPITFQFPLLPSPEYRLRGLGSA